MTPRPAFFCAWVRTPANDNLPAACRFALNRSPEGA